MVAEFSKIKQRFATIYELLNYRKANKRLAERLAGGVDLDDIDVKAIDANVETAANDFDKVKGELEKIVGTIHAGTKTSAYGSLVKTAAQKTQQDTQAALYDEFWNQYQTNGTRTNYEAAFEMWNKFTFQPKYDLVVKQGQNMFKAFGMLAAADGATYKSDLVTLLENADVTLDTSQATTLNCMFKSSRFTRVGTIDASGVIESAGFESVFADTQNLETIDRLIVKPSLKMATTFNKARALQNITFEGEIGEDVFLAHSPNLSSATLSSLIAALDDHAAYMYTKKVSLMGNAKAKLTEKQIAALTAKGWVLE